MKHVFHLGNGAWFRLGWSLAIGVGLVAMTAPSFSAELSSHAYPPLLSAGAAGDSSSPLVSDDGRFVVFVSAAENLTANDGNHFMDVFLRDREAQTTTLLSTNDAGVSSRLGHSVAPSISAGGELVTYEMRQVSTNPGVFGGIMQLTNTAGFLIDQLAGSRRSIGIADGLMLPSISGDPPSTNWISYSNPTAKDLYLTSDGQKLIFRTLGLPYWESDLLVELNLNSGITNLFCTALPPYFAPNSELQGARFSDEGNWAAFYTSANNLHPLKQVEGPLAVYVYDQAANSNILVSISQDGSSAASKDSDSPDISANGRFVVFVSNSTNLVATDTNLNRDIFLRDLEAGTTILVSSNRDGITTSLSGNSDAPAISRDGRWIAFFSNASDLVADDANGATGDVYLRDNQTGVVTLISNHPDWHGRLASGAQAPQINSDGSFVLYQAPGSGLFLYDRATGSSRLLTEDVVADSPAMSSDGRFVVFSSRTIPGFVGGKDAHRQIYLFDRELNSFELISKRDPVLPLASANEATRYEAGVVATADNLLLARSYATDLGLRADDRKLRLWNLSNTGTPLAEDLGDIDGTPVETAKAIHLNASADGRWLVFDYDEPALASVETNSGWHVVLHDRATSENRVLNHSTDEVDEAHFPAIAADGSAVFWRPDASSLDQFEVASSTHRHVIAYGNSSGVAESPMFTPDGRLMFFRYLGDAIPDVLNEAFPNWGLLELKLSDLSIKSISNPSAQRPSSYVSVARVSSDSAAIVVETDDSSIPPSISFASLLEGRGLGFGVVITTNGSNPQFGGNLVAYESAEIVPSAVRNPGAPVIFQDTNDVTDVFLKSSSSEINSLISVNYAGTGTGNGRSKLLGFSPDGRFVLFHSWASDLVANDTNQLGDLFLRDLRTQTTLMLTVGLNLAAADGNTSARAMFNKDGTKIIFESYAPNLVAGDFNETRDVYTATLSLPDSDGDGLPDSWELTWFGTLARDGTGDFDNDGVSDHDEFIAGTNPVNNLSVLEALTIRSSNSGQPEILWAAVPGRSYRVQYKDDFNIAGWTNLPGDVVAGSSTGVRIDDSGTAGEKRFYRVLILP